MEWPSASVEPIAPVVETAHIPLFVEPDALIVPAAVGVVGGELL